MATLSETRLQQMTMLKQKSWNNWLVEGSSNSSFFHNSIRIRKSSNTISELVDSNGTCITYYEQLRDHVVQYYEDKFNGQELDNEGDLFDFEHDSVSVEESNAMDKIPTPEEIKQAVFDLGSDSAPGPDGFSGCFYRHCWDIIQEDLIKAILHCWNSGHIPNGVNSSLIIFLAKVRGANTLRNFRTIGLSNFFFKIFTKILATRLGSVLDNLVSEEQVAFMKGRNIHENISLASEMVNELHFKRKDGNIGIKLDISQSFDTTFLAEILRKIRDKKMTPMVTRGGVSPTYLFFADDIMIFCKGNSKSLHNLVDLLGKYQRASGQTVCHQKSKIYYGGGSSSWCTYLANYLGMSVATFPDRYLGVQIMPGTVRYRHICNVVEKIKNKLAGWKGRLLYFHDRIVLVKTVISSYSIHNMAIYNWPRKFILQCERAIQNFIWSSDSNVSRAVVVAYDKICCPYEEGGLGINRMATMNKALLMKLWWKIRISKKKWDFYLKAKFFYRNGSIKNSGVKSTILPGVRSVYNLVEKNTKVLIGDGRDTSLYYDIWYANISISEALNDYTLDNTVRVSDVLTDGQWDIPYIHLQRMVAAGLEMHTMPMPIGGADTRVWMPELTGEFSVKSATSLVRHKYPNLKGEKLLWRKEVHLVLTAQNWKFLRGAYATYDLIKSRFKKFLANKCCICGIEEETLFHVMYDYSFAARAWNWLADFFNLHPNANLVISFKASKGRSPMVRDLWLVANLVLRSVKWQQPVECFWHPPDANELQLCCDGVARGNPGIAGAGVVARDAQCSVLGAMSIGLGVTTNYLAELYGIIVGLEWAMQWDFDRICVRSDSMGVVEAIKNNSIPWFAKNRWTVIFRHYTSIRNVMDVEHLLNNPNENDAVMESPTDEEIIESVMNNENDPEPDDSSVVPNVSSKDAFQAMVT
ncbi:uncharacterized protein LOC113295565 [Papaver somniferum]|uniref:uncharacterized protein LOC113295565 n=1 Tax=Papaver somniferum TaxID=3469 RepID=UPI000E6F9A03|nr:uncharacterized protein LOC113295565 [Papaver somniferum]